MSAATATRIFVVNGLGNLPATPKQRLLWEIHSSGIQEGCFSRSNEVIVKSAVTVCACWWKLAMFGVHGNAHDIEDSFVNSTKYDIVVAVCLKI